MKSILSIFFVALCIIGFSSCKKISGSGPVVQEIRSVSNFNAISADLNADIYISQDSVFNVEISAQQNILDILETHVSAHELQIGYNGSYHIGHHDKITIYIAAPNFTALSNSGSGNMIINQKIAANELKLTIAGSGSINLQEAGTQHLTHKISGSGSILVSSGTSQNETVEIAGSGSVDALGLQVNNVSTRTSGSGTIRIHATEKLNVHISGSGNVIYKGHPQITTSISGSGKLQPW